MLAPGGKPPPEGHIQRNPDLADVLEVLAAEGPRFFTEGEVGQALLAMPGSALTPADLTAAPVWRQPLLRTRADQTVALNPPPSLGGVQIALALALAPHDPGPVATARALRETARMRADLRIDQNPETAARLLDPALIEGLQKALARKPAQTGTTHISVIAADGSGAALSLSNGAGSGRLIPGTGIQPNNMLGEEDLVPAGPTGWAPGKRLASMMSPTAVRAQDGTLTLLGSGGSNRIRSAITTTLIELIDRGRSPEDALSAPRMHIEGRKLDFEDTGGEEHRAALLAHDSAAKPWPGQHMFFGGVHIVRHGPGGTQAAADRRRDGSALSGP